MTAKTLTLTDFLLARFAEDEAGNGCNGEGEYSTCGDRSERIERECEAKRRIVGAFVDAPDLETMNITAFAVRILASIYADHPDFREEWRP